MKKFIAYIFTLFLVTSCALTPSKKTPEPAEASVIAELNKAHVERASGAKGKAILRLKKIIQNHPHTDAANDAAVMLGEIYYSSGDYESAYTAFMSVVNSEYFSAKEIDALTWSAKSLNKLGRYDEAQALITKGLKFRTISDGLRLELYKLKYQISTQLGDRLEGLAALIYLANNDKEKVARDSFRIKAIDFVQTQLSDKDLEQVLKNSQFDFVRGYAHFRFGYIYYDQKDYSRARDSFERVQDLIPDTDYAEKAKLLVAQIDSRRRVEPMVIGAVLPLTGKHSHIAQKTLRGLLLGLGIYGKNQDGFKLAVIDSEGNPDVARRAVEKLIGEDHVVAIVGCLLSKTATAVSSKAQELGVPVIGLSQKSGLTDVGDYTFRNALTSEMQIQQLVKTAIQDKKLKRFAILYPNDPYGVEYANLFWDAVLAWGGQITAVQMFDPKETDFNGTVQRLIGTYYLEDRQEEYKFKVQDWIKKQKTITARKSPPDNLLPPVVDFDAIFIPDGVKTVGQVAAMLSYNDVDNVKLLGTNLWNNSDLVQRAQKHAEGALFVDSYWEGDNSYKQSKFYKEYKAVYGETPGVFEVQGYDTGLVLRQIIASGENTRIGLKDRLSLISNFNGALGPMDMSSRRELTRPLVNLTVENGQIKLLSSQTN